MFMCGDLGRGVSLRMESTSARMPGRDDALLPARDDARVPLPAAAHHKAQGHGAPRERRGALRRYSHGGRWKCGDVAARS